VTAFSQQQENEENVQITKKILEENLTKSTSICPWFSAQVVLRANYVLEAEHQRVAQVGNLRVLVGLYKRLSESGLLKKGIAWISPTRTRLF